MIKYEGDFKSFSGDEQNLLRALKKGFFIYADILHTLIDHHDDKQAAKDVYHKYPEIHDFIPDEYDNPEHLIEVLLEVAKDYQWQLERFAEKHMKAINSALKKNAKNAAPRRSEIAKAARQRDANGAIKELDI